MKTSLFISYLLVAFIAMVSCDPTSPAPAINYKIKELTIYLMTIQLITLFHMMAQI